MNIEDIRDYCLVKKGVTESTPFDDVTLTFKVAGKIFAFLPLDAITPTINLKCNPPEWAVELREQYVAISPGYHMNKTHWNTVTLNGSISNRLIMEMIDHSYDLVVNKLSKKQREMISE